MATSKMKAENLSRQPGIPAKNQVDGAYKYELTGRLYRYTDSDGKPMESRRDWRMPKSCRREWAQENLKTLAQASLAACALFALVWGLALLNALIS